MWTIDPKIPMTLWWALALAAIATIGFYALRKQWSVQPIQRILLTCLLAAGLIGPLVIALNPTWVETIPPIPGNPLITVLVDGTMSMRTEDIGRNKVQSRWSRAVELAWQVKPKTSLIDSPNSMHVDVRHMAFGDAVKPLPSMQSLQAAARSASGRINNSADDSEEDNHAWPQGHRSDLSSALRQAVRTGSPVGHAVLMISDGAHNVGSVESVLQLAREANALATPIYTVTVGTSIGMKNMSLAAKNSRMIAFPNNPIAIRVMLTHSGLEGQETEVGLFRDDQLIDSRRVKLSPENNQEVRFNIEQGAQAPLERYRLVASEVLGEVTTADNQTTVVVQRLNHPIGVLILEGKPYWDSKFLARNMALDPVVDLSTIVRMSSDRFLVRHISRAALGDPNQASGATTQEPSESKATSEEWTIDEKLKSPLEAVDLLEKYRLVILGRDADVYLTEAAIENLREWISKSGGCLLCARGAPTDTISGKLAELLPVRWTPGMESRFRARVSPHGLDSSVFDPLLADGVDPLGSLPSLAVGSAPKERPGLPQVLMQSAADQGDGSVPIVTYQPFGSGQTIVVEGAGMWRWAFLPPQHAEKDKIYPTLWQSMVQWIISQQDMMPGQEVGIRADRATFLSGDRTSASITVRHPTQWLRNNSIDALSVTLQSASQELPKRYSLINSGSDPGLYRVDMGALDIGFYTVKLVRGVSDDVVAATAFEVRDPWFESLEVDARPDLMSQVARLSGGKVLEPEQVDELIGQFEERMRSQQSNDEIRTTMWDRPLVLLVILMGWIATWIVRRQSGLV